jgi:hypothetical protein
MPVNTLSCVPPRFEAGNTIVWTQDFPRYPASEWSLSFVLSQAGQVKATVSGVPSGDSFTVTLTSTVTDRLAGGTYDWAEYVTQSGERATAATGTLIVLPNLATNAAPSFAEQQVELLQTALATLAAGTNETVNINGQSFTKRNIETYQKQLTYWEARVFQEQQRQAALRGNRSENRVRTVFVSPYCGVQPYVGAPWANGYNGGNCG